MTNLKKHLITLFHPLSSFPSELILVVLNKRSLGSAISAALPRLAAFLGLSRVEGSFAFQSPVSRWHGFSP
jgi:hypothetical protein